jgi:hypothetical protein
MSKKKKLNKKIRDSYGTITLKELIDRGECSPFHHLSDGNYIGGLTIPNSTGIE